MKKCAACGEAQEPGAIFCTNCGQRLTQDSNGRKCPSCGASNEQDAAFCIHCGSRLEGPEEPHASDTSPMTTQLLALSNDFLSVRETAPGRFEFSSETGTRSPLQKVKIKYEAVAQLETQTKQLTFWEKMVESSAGITAGVFAEKTAQKGIDVSKNIHGHLLFGGKYGFEYGKLKDVVKVIAGENGWHYKTVLFKPDIGKEKASKDFWKRRLSMKILIPVVVLFFIALLGSVAYVYFSGRSNAGSSDQRSANRGFAQTGSENDQSQQIIKTDKDTYDYGERIRVQYFNAPGHSRDWICIVPEGSRNTYAGDYQYIPRRGEGVLTFASPSPGKYEARVFYRYFPGQYRITARYNFTVED
ncbi:MAG: zinc ribbon domain-containing protein [Syntrophaceae bacterium]|nr:zinc ribbon domain-containing protein [Syntrophaceae bacterium]